VPEVNIHIHIIYLGIKEVKEGRTEGRKEVEEVKEGKKEEERGNIKEGRTRSEVKDVIVHIIYLDTKK